MRILKMLIVTFSKFSQKYEIFDRVENRFSPLVTTLKSKNFAPKLKIITFLTNFKKLLFSGRMF